MIHVPEPVAAPVPAAPRRDTAPRAAPALPASGTGGVFLLEESIANEKIIALWRLVFCLVAAVQLVVSLSFDRPALGAHDWAALVGVFAAVLYSAGLFAVIGPLGDRRWLSFLSAGMDVTLISGALFALAFSGQPLFAVNNPIAIPLYLLAISLAGLRYNPGITVFATLLAAVQYAALVWYATRVGDLYNLGNAAVRAQVERYGTFDLVMQLTRFILIGSGGVVATFSVRRARDLRTASILDALTRVYNRAFFDERYLHEFDRAARYRRELAIAIFDVDWFKQYNDRNGHLEGDRVLREVADLLRQGLRSTDIVARYGGEEFVALLPETSKAQAMVLLDRLRQQIEQHEFAFGEHQPGGRLTISVGLAAYPLDGDAPVTLFEHADQALYEAKGAGRNRVRG